MSLVVFEELARAHFANPPAAWHIQSTPDSFSWNVVDIHGAPVATCLTKEQANESRHSGFAAAQWYQRTDWYLGYGRGRALTCAERLIIADIVESFSRAAEQFRSASALRPVRFLDQSADDDRIWDAALLADGQYLLHGDYFHTYRAKDLDFLDHRSIAATTDLAAFLRDLLSDTATCGSA